jgi:putative endonuclease
VTAARRDLGKWGEEIAARHLESKGYRILGRNVRTLRGEIDVLARAGEILVFVEVKTGARSQSGSHPAENVHAQKRRRLTHAAEAYLAGLGRVPECRFDVVTVIREPVPQVEHFIGAFEAQA